MQVRTPARRTGIRLVGAAAFAALVAFGVAFLSRTADEAGTPVAGAIVHAPSAAYVDFAHGAFDRFRDAPPARTIDAAGQTQAQPSRI
ncbi:hypothetical protein [Phreatobacter cathodiphilus]|uniref:Uncharacterized protein n=1 Tax=Phreatobacter cathodiphilus TaxID=1868589 RepID=A0A2S0NG86_9HYPH|nr:hypothetical protein [Phreatobacter cathodiphilus]AVO47190.1 hypothetical protein C6569_20260 [Phreatobacter cathodiphilus]